MLLVLTVACAREDARAGDEAADSTPAEGQGAFAPLTDTLDRADDVQSTIDARAEELRRRIEQDEE